ncbi:hypothetical protein CYMTET_46487 [Cymbomonas tetramitiformis]|uniref:HEAT repeat domain-containing protein n=1 Tax=Cymbomonas tetramitiformis TaxID=36881 RepID=A0AAE0BW15_9CHLO|nr:hypothetical protein CYMTET_46487 [Cymbomonas tetramitiformis]
MDHIDGLSAELMAKIWNMGLGRGAIAAVCCVSRRWRQEAGPGAAAIRALANPNCGRVIQAALEALGGLEERAAPYAGAIAARLEHVDARVKRAAVDALGRLGEHATPHVGAIVALLEDANEDVDGQHGAGGGWGACSTTCRAIAARLEDPETGVREEAVVALGRLGSM